MEQSTIKPRRVPSKCYIPTLHRSLPTARWLHVYLQKLLRPKKCVFVGEEWRKYSKNATWDNLNGANLKVNAVHFQCQYWHVGEHGCRLFLNIWALVKFEKFPRKNSTIWLSCSSKSVRSYATAKGSRDCWIHCLFILLSHLSKFRKLKTLPSYRPWNSSTP